MVNWEEKFGVWSLGPSQAELDRCARTAREISEALRSWPALQRRSLEVFAQGSFANRTNVKRESDVDICSLCDETYHYDVPISRSINDVESSVIAATYKYSEYKNDVEAALVTRFGRESVVRGNKAFDIHNRRHDIDADVVATFEYRDYRIPGGARGYVAGTAMFCDDGKFVTNFPKQQYDNGVFKHDATRRRFKRQVRIQKNLRNEMDDNGKVAARPIASFLIESLCWNAPNFCYGHASYFLDFEAVMQWLYEKTASDMEAAGLLEVNGIKRLFGQSSWTRAEVRSYIEAAWAYTH